LPSPIPALDVVFPWDKVLFRGVNAFARQTDWLHGAMLTYASYGVVLFAGLLLVGWWVARSTGDLVKVAAAWWVPVGALVALAVNQPLVNAFREPRPYSVLTNITVLAHRSGDYSFPSDHAVMAGAVAGGLFLVNRRLGVVAAAAALLLAFARVYIGAHWPGDVLVGLMVGGLVVIGGFKALQRPLVAVVSFLVRTPLRPLLVAGGDGGDGASAAQAALQTGSRDEPAPADADADA
jgi:membrane-associated phospholipid phosphatase